MEHSNPEWRYQAPWNEGTTWITGVFEDVISQIGKAGDGRCELLVLGGWYLSFVSSCFRNDSTLYQVLLIFQLCILVLVFPGGQRLTFPSGFCLPSQVPSPDHNLYEARASPRVMEGWEWMIYVDTSCVTGKGGEKKTEKLPGPGLF